VCFDTSLVILDIRLLRVLDLVCVIFWCFDVVGLE